MSVDPNARIAFCRLYERTSARGNRYLVGRLGYARLIAFQGEPTEDGTPTWDVFVSPADQGAREKSAQRREGAGASTTPAPTPERAPAGSGAPRRGHPAAATAEADGDADGIDWQRGDDLPF